MQQATPASGGKEAAGVEAAEQGAHATVPERETEGEAEQGALVVQLMERLSEVDSTMDQVNGGHLCLCLTM